MIDMIVTHNKATDRGYHLICGLVFVALYSNVLKLWFGSWATLVYDAMLVCALITLVNYRWNPKRIKVLTAILVSSLLLLILGAFEMLNPNITNQLYSLIEFRKTLFQLLTLFVVYAYCSDSGDGETNCKIIRFIVLASLPLILYGIKQFYFFDSSSDIVFFGSFLLWDVLRLEHGFVHLSC